MSEIDFERLSLADYAQLFQVGCCSATAGESFSFRSVPIWTCWSRAAPMTTERE
jgi:hypothetical protein